MNHANKCLLAQRCNVVNTKACSPSCGHYLRMHGFSGTGGRSGSAGAPADYRMLTLKNSPAREEQAKIYEVLDKYVSTFERQFEDGAERIKSLYLWSESPGNGKTTTATTLLNEWIIANYLGSLKHGRQALQTPAFFLDCNDWQTLFNEFNRKNIPQEIGEKASAEYYRRMQLAKNAPFVIIDDLGVRDATTAFRGDLHSVINHRAVNSLPTIYTSNLPIEELAVTFDKRLYDRVRDMCQTIHFSGTSKRGKRR